MLLHEGQVGVFGVVVLAVVVAIDHEVVVEGDLAEAIDAGEGGVVEVVAKDGAALAVAFGEGFDAGVVMALVHPFDLRQVDVDVAVEFRAAVWGLFCCAMAAAEEQRHDEG